MAQAGATFTTLGTRPANKACIPSLWYSCIMRRNVEVTCVEPLTRVSPREICRWVLITSKGKVNIAAIPPDKAPQLKLSTIVILSDMVFFKMTDFMLSYPNQ